MENLNEFLVGLFNEILKIEGNALCSGEAQEISVRDMHIIEAICAGKSMRERRTTAVAQRKRDMWSVSRTPPTGGWFCSL